MFLFPDLVYPIATLRLGGLDLQTLLLGRGRQEAPHAVRLPSGALLDFG